jgi:hypothetical protein
MHCFNHPTYEAAGVCRSCGRALCHDCIAICEEAVACKGKCEERVTAIQHMITMNQVTSRSLPTQMRQGGIYASTVGLMFAVMGGIFFACINDDFGHFVGGAFILLGTMILIRGVTAVRNSLKYPRTDNKKPAAPTMFAADSFSKTH